MKACLIIRGKKLDDTKFRPGTNTPDLHWAYRLLDPYIDYTDPGRPKYPEHMQINWADENDPGSKGITVEISDKLWEHNETAFINIMEFVRVNDLEYEFPNNMEACGACDGHISCLSKCHIVNFDVEDIV